TIREAVARLTLGAHTKTDDRPMHLNPNDAARQRAAEARASLLAAGAAGRNAEAELLRAQYIAYSPTMNLPEPARHPTLRHQQSAPAQRRAAVWAGGARDSLTIGDDLYAIINEFSVVADGRYGEVDARSLRKKGPRPDKPAPQYTAPSPGTVAASPEMYGSEQRTVVLAGSGSRGDVHHGPAADSSSSAASNFGPLVVRRGSRTSMSVESDAASQPDYGRHTAARARAWAARQKDRMLHAFSGEKGPRQPLSPGTASGMRAVSPDPSLLSGMTAALLMPMPPGLRFHHQSHSTANIAVAPMPSRLSKIP
ncbi:hypothetical protein LPJ61_006861, partial [Coemansia biformis]